MTQGETGRARRILAHACAAIALSACQMPSAQAFDAGVIKNCAGDYLSYCSAHSPESRSTRLCMEANRLRLKPACVQALLAGGEVPRKYLNKRADEGK